MSADTEGQARKAEILHSLMDDVGLGGSFESHLEGASTTLSVLFDYFKQTSPQAKHDIALLEAASEFVEELLNQEFGTDEED